MTASAWSSLLEPICSENLGVYKVSPIRLPEDTSQEAQISNDYRGRLTYELLQNADDAMNDARSLTTGSSSALPTTRCGSATPVER